MQYYQTLFSGDGRGGFGLERGQKRRGALRFRQ